MQGEVVQEEEEDEVLRAWREDDHELKGLRDELQREVDSVEGVAHAADAEVAAELASRSASTQGPRANQAAKREEVAQARAATEVVGAQTQVGTAAGSACVDSVGSEARPASAVRTASPTHSMGLGGPPEAASVVKAVSVEQLLLLQGQLSVFCARRCVLLGSAGWRGAGGKFYNI